MRYEVKAPMSILSVPVSVSASRQPRGSLTRTTPPARVLGVSCPVYHGPMRDSLAPSPVYFSLPSFRCSTPRTSGARGRHGLAANVARPLHGQLCGRASALENQRSKMLWIPQAYPQSHCAALRRSTLISRPSCRERLRSQKNPSKNIYSRPSR